MAQREGSIYLSLFVASFLLFAMAVVAAFWLHGETERLKGEIQEEKSKFAEAELNSRKLTDERDKLRVLIAGPTGADDWPGEAQYLDELKNLETDFNEILESENTDLNKANFGALTEPYSHLVSLVNNLASERNTLRISAESKRKEVTTLRDSHARVRQDLDADKTKISEELATVQTQLEEAEQQSRTKIDDLSNENEEHLEEIDRLKRENQRQVAILTNEIRTLKLRLDVLNEERNAVKSIEDVLADGSIIDVESRSGLAWINLGRDDNLRNGVVFRIFQDIGGKKVWKGRLEVRRVDQEYSQVKILEQVSALNPIAAGDNITSVFYDRNSKPLFVFAGDKGTIKLDSIKRKLQSMGANVQEEVGVNTSFLVALKDYEGTSAYQAAKDLGVTIMTERDLMEYLGR